MSEDEYPRLQTDDIRAALPYAAEALAHEDALPLAASAWDQPRSSSSTTSSAGARRAKVASLVTKAVAL